MTLRCPKCGNYKLDFVLTEDPMGNTDEYWHCETCDYNFDENEVYPTTTVTL